mmetsp:Transcript_10161/g.15202  ORF Transcript_10161/g.15202 Transcript_10161/m.15202 type:complete len:164 (-) Transcript_10161:122-613(-)
MSDTFSIINKINEADFDDISLQYNKIDIMTLMTKARSPKAGAVSSFFGTTRDTFEDKTVTYLEYEAYPDMALLSMSELCTKARKTWNLMNIILVHKLGECPTSDISIGIVVSSVHRKDSLSAVNYLIDELKKVVPIWKRECYDTGETTWKSNKVDSAGPADFN